MSTDGYPITQHTHPLAPHYVFLEFPKHRHHLTLGWREVQTAEEEARLTPDDEGWTDDLLELTTQKVISTDRLVVPKKRSHHRKPEPEPEPDDAFVPVLGGMSTD